MADYAKKKNDELAQLCKERSLPHTGKKADLVKRLEEYDAKQTTSAASEAPAAQEDEIDWDDEPATETAKAATTEPAANAIAAGGQGEVKNPQAVPNQEAAIDPAQTDDLKVAAVPAAEEPKEDDSKFAAGLVERTLEEEIEKRKARARRFGMPEDSEEIKALERAKRFGTADLPGLLNKALPTDVKREGKKRGRDGPQDGGIRKVSRGPGAGRKGGDRPKAEKKASEKTSDGYPSWMSQGDKDAAERRKAKFAAN